MTDVFKLDNISIQKKNNEYIFEVTSLNEINKTIFIDSLDLDNVVIKSGEKKCFKTGTCKISFKANKVTSLSKLISNNCFLDYINLVSLFLK